MAGFRVTLTNLRTTETFAFPITPEKLSETLPEAVYKDLEIQGHSSELQQYSHTKNHAFTFRFRMDALARPEWNSTLQEDARRFLMSIPIAIPSDQVGYQEPATVLFLWPRLVSLECNLRGAPKLEHTRFVGDGPRAGLPTLTEGEINLSVVRFNRILPDDLRRDGTAGGP